MLQQHDTYSSAISDKNSAGHTIVNSHKIDNNIYLSEASSNEYVTFKIDNEEYAINILNVHEIRCYEAPTHMTNSSEYIRGVIDLRGEIVPIFDLRIKMGKVNVNYSEFTVVIIVNIAGRSIGMIVDGVSDVLLIENSQIKPTPNINGAIASDCAFGIVSIQNRMIVLLDVKSLMHESLPSMFER